MENSKGWSDMSLCTPEISNLQRGYPVDEGGIPGGLNPFVLATSEHPKLSNPFVSNPFDYTPLTCASCYASSSHSLYHHNFSTAGTAGCHSVYTNDYTVGNHSGFASATAGGGDRGSSRFVPKVFSTPVVYGGVVSGTNPFVAGSAVGNVGNNVSQGTLIGLQSQIETLREELSRCQMDNNQLGSRSFSGNQNVGVPTKRAMFPEKFDGTGEWEEFIKHFNDVASWNQWSNKDKATQLGLHLTGIARSVKMDLPGHILADFDLLVLTLSKYFSTEGQESAFQAQFRKRVRNKGEKLVDFGHDLTRLCRKAFPNMERAARELFVMEHFKLGLDPDLRRHVQFQHPSTLEQAIVAGLEYEAVDDDGLKTRKPVNVCAVSPEEKRSEDSQGLTQMLQALTAQNAKLMEQNREANEKFLEVLGRMSKNIGMRRGPRDISQITCFLCSGKGHYQSSCPQRSMESSQSGNE